MTFESEAAKDPNAPKALPRACIPEVWRACLPAVGLKT